MRYRANWADPIVLDPGSIFVPLLEELVELISVETWRVLWKYVESRSKRFTKVHHHTRLLCLLRHRCFCSCHTAIHS